MRRKDHVEDPAIDRRLC